MAVGYNTGLAAEFYVLSVLHRLGYHASLTLGNRKAIDIVVETDLRTCTIDVKGMAGRTNWPLDNFKSQLKRNHFIALVSFNGRIGDPSVLPTVFLVPAAAVPKFLYRNPKGNRTTIPFRKIRDEGPKYLEAWALIGATEAGQPSTSPLPRRSRASSRA